MEEKEEEEDNDCIIKLWGHGFQTEINIIIFIITSVWKVILIWCHKLTKKNETLALNERETFLL